MLPVGRRPTAAAAWIVLIVCLSGAAVGSGDPARIVEVALAVDTGCSEREIRSLESLMSTVSDLFEREFSIRFRIGSPRRWCNTADCQTIDDLFPHFLKAMPKGDVDFVVGMTCGPGLSGKYGISYFQEGYILLRKVAGAEKLKRILAHEICHLFGAVHLDDRGALMDRFLRGDLIRPATKALVRLHRDRDFRGRRFPLSRRKCREALKLYEEIGALNEASVTGGLGAAEQKAIRSWLHDGEATAGCDAAMKRFDRLEDVYLSAALMQIELGKYDAAMETCGRVLRMNPECHEAHNLMGISSRRSGRIEAAIGHYRTALKMNPSYLRIHFNLGIALMKAGRLKEAEKAYSRAVGANPNFAEAWNNLGFLCLETDDLKGAVRHFERAIGHNPYLPLAHSNLAEACLRSGEIDRALKSVRRALRLNPDLPGPHNVLGKLHVRRGDPEAAEREYRRAVELDPAYHKAYYNLGNLHLRQKRSDLACESFRACITANPGFPAAFSGLGDAHLLAGRLAEAEAAFLEGIRRGYAEPPVYVNLSVIGIATGDFSTAARMARRALELDPQLAEARQNLGIALFRLGRLEEAEEALTSAVERNPDLTDAWSALGHISLQAGRMPAAVSCYSRSLDTGGANGQIHNNMAVALYFMKDFERAWIHLVEAERCGFAVNADFKRKVFRALGEK